MSGYMGKEGLYKKTESSVKESVTQNEGLYRRKEIADIHIENPTEEQKEANNTLEKTVNHSKRLLKE